MAQAQPCIRTMFQSSPVTKDGRYREQGTRITTITGFQSSPVTKDGRYATIYGNPATIIPVSILARH